MEKPTYAVGDRVEKLCAVCNEVRGHVVATVTKQGRISRVQCPQCGTRSSFKSTQGKTASSTGAKTGTVYDRTRTYRIGQSMVHPQYGYGEVTALIEPKKIDVLFEDRMRRLIHSQIAAPV
ncbi:MAG: hypothetical protein LC754_19165 [Acidobacteria bacterium]|nr:hypothetical protein [Acidobacteriota bacterium]